MDIDRLGEWQMEFNVDKCEVMHFGQKNGKTTYYLNGEDFGVLQCRGIWVFSFMSHRKLACSTADNKESKWNVGIYG